MCRDKSLQPFTPLDLLSAGSGCVSKFLKTLGSVFKSLLIFLVILTLLGASFLVAFIYYFFSKYKSANVDGLSFWNELSVLMKLF